MSEKRRALLYFSLFMAFVFLAASPYGESVENVLVYPAIAAILLLSLIALYSWWRNLNGDPATQTDARLWKQIQDLFRFPW